MYRVLTYAFLVIFVFITACATVPTGPSVMSLPGTGKSFEQFRSDDITCRQFAYEQAGGARQAAENAAVTSAIVGTVIGAAAGAAIGSASGDVGAGAAIGAGSGLLVGSTAGSSSASVSYYEAQRRYDHAYLQCMYAKGNRIPVYGRFTESLFQEQPGRDIPPPPSGYPPPPPPPGR